MAIRDRIKSKVSQPVKSELTTLAGEQVEVRQMMVGQRSRVLEVGYRTVGKRTEPIYSKLYPILLKQTVFDPESGEPVFQKDDDELINSLDAEEVDAVAEIAFRLSGLDKKSGQEMGKGSGTESETDDSSSELPGMSAEP